ncbi:uncharacterized protein [Montipora foliosa]|uniref:uncharacterized protein n=1 Tax=Montipora foliosa TaxID=591990 RepID=UPI0035F14071
MKTPSLLLICVAICQIVDETKSQQCPAFGSEESILGWMLQGHIYQTMTANIGLDCLAVCLKDDRCQSFNFVMSLHKCEFSDRTKEARPEDFIPDADRYYFRKYINRVPLGSISELAAESCKEIKMSEGRSPNGKYWMSSIKPGIPVLAFCDMKTEDVNECTASSPVCHVNATCNNTLGSYQCTCKPGYAGDGNTCKDVNECTASSPVCHVNATCNNTLGSYQCTCKPGYAGDGNTCKGTWSKHRPELGTQWCTGSGRVSLATRVTLQACKQLCVKRKPKCLAVEFWESGIKYCYECTNLGMITRYTNTQDGAYPVYVWIRN